ncbi:MAG: TetR/AcrR family transcriptional regulator [Candidatus Aminicenantes bacterium]|nr:TetR/AcrR family transcriptional regulator [Candidatus Aminicenantes bacterium]
MGVKERRKREEKARLATILVAAENIFSEHGYYQARMDDIAEAAELAKGTLYYYFKSKDEIFLHLLERESKRVHEEIQKRISEESSFLEALEEAMEFYLEYFEENHGFMKMFLPCMCGFIRFEDERTLRQSTKSFEYHGEYVREMLKRKMSREGVSFRLEDLLKFIKTLQIGIGLKLLEGNKAEAKAAARFFLDLMKKVMEAKP